MKLNIDSIDREVQKKHGKVREGQNITKLKQSFPSIRNFDNLKLTAVVNFNVQVNFIKWQRADF